MERSLSLANAVSREDIDTIKRTVAPDATDIELKQFIHLAVKYNLDPMAREIYFSKMGGRPSYIVGRDGYLKIAMMDPGYAGLQSFTVKEGDHFEIDVEANRVIHKFGAKRGPIIGAWAIARHTKRPPVMCFVEFGEYRGNSPIWSKYPSAMIQKVAEVFVLRRQFNISGLVSQEEIGVPEEVRYGGPVEPEVVSHPSYSTAPDPLDAAREANAKVVEIAKSMGAPVVEIVDDEPAPAVNEDTHPNKTTITTALTKSIYIQGTKAGLSNEKVKERAREMFDKPELQSLYDLGKDREPYTKLLQALAKEVAPSA
jgi:hypothetical protein